MLAFSKGFKGGVHPARALGLEDTDTVYIPWDFGTSRAEKGAGIFILQDAFVQKASMVECWP